MGEKQGHTPGPWAWMGSPHGLYLATTRTGRQHVMGFRRMGFSGAQPVFRDNHRMVPAADIVQFEVGDRSVRGFAQAKENESVYRFDVDGIDNADARLIAAAPELLAAAQQALSHCDPNGYLDCGKPATDALRAAISRATGEDGPANEGEGAS
ncbi:hypothetical protein [Brevundimonas sp. Marseille-Q4549]